MTVYKGYLAIAKKNAGMFLLYVAIFFGITLLFQRMSGVEEKPGYHRERLSVAVIDEDQGAFANALISYLGEFHKITKMQDDTAALQEKLFYRDVEYIVRIPNDFYRKCVIDKEPLKVTKIPGTYAASFADSQIDSFLSRARAYAAAGFSEEETEEAGLHPAEAEVELLDTGGSTGETPMYIMYFRYLPYLFLGVLGYVVGSMISAMRRGDLKQRMKASAVSVRRQSVEGILGCTTVALMLWGIILAAAVLFYGKDLLFDDALWYYVLNSFAVLCVSVSVSFLIGNLAKSNSSLNGLVNVASLGMCFLGGAFVPLEVMSSGMKKAAQFLPVYWFEYANGLLEDFHVSTVKSGVLQAIGMQFLFVLGFVCVTMAIKKVASGSEI